MQMTGNTIFSTGGTSGIDRALADARHARGNKVILARHDHRDRQSGAPKGAADRHVAPCRRPPCRGDLVLRCAKANGNCSAPAIVSAGQTLAIALGLPLGAV